MKRMVTVFLLLTLYFHVPRSARGEPLQPQDVPKEVYLDRSGLPELVLQNTLYGAYGGMFLMQTLAGEDDAARISAGMILGSIAGFTLPFVFFRGEPVHAAPAAFYNFAERLGISNGVLLPMLWEEDSFRTVSGFAVGMGLASLGVAIHLYPGLRLTPGQVSALGTGHQLGFLTGLLGMVLLDLDVDSGAAIAGPMLLAANAGVLAAFLARDRFDVDRRRVIWTDIGSVVGVGAGFGLGLLLAGDGGSERLYAATALVGMYGGAIAAYFLAGDMDEYKKSSQPEDRQQTAFQFQSPTPRLIPSFDQARNRSVIGFGIDLLGGRW
ncbi:MAG: hypothetical protein V2A73_12990 [Pseudomonadota bacterium]